MLKLIEFGNAITLEAGILKELALKPSTYQDLTIQELTLACHVFVDVSYIYEQTTLKYGTKKFLHP